MTDFNQTNWAKAEFSRNYREKADIYIVERRRMLGILQSCYRQFVQKAGGSSIADLGCGDGIITSSILEVDKEISATLIDGSEDMLQKARERLKGFAGVEYIRATFDEVIERPPHRRFDMVASSLAIHHLNLSEKQALFRSVYSLLRRGGHFVNIDVVLAPTERLENWYLQLWRDWMEEKASLTGAESFDFDVIARYKDNRDNKPDRLEDQLQALRDCGFREVDCYYKYGIFTMYGGKR